MRRLVIALLLVLAGGSALAHAELRTSEPAAGAVVGAGPQEVQLSFSEPLETLFSVFKVYPLAAGDVDPAADNAAQRLNGLAATLVNEVLELRDDADEKVPAELVSAEATTAELKLTFQEPLPDGHYVVMWRVLSIDTHVTEGFFVFSVVSAD